MKSAVLYISIAAAALTMSCQKQYPKPDIVVIDNDEMAQNIVVPKEADAPVVVKNTTKITTGKVRENIIAYAEKYLGTNYCYASADPAKGFDCSGFVNYVFKHFDIDLPRSSKNFKNLAPGLKPEQFKKGDVLVFYGYRDSTSIGHVGIVYEADGMNSKFIHASSGGEKEVMISDLGSDMYTKRFYKCINVLNL